MWQENKTNVVGHARENWLEPSLAVARFWCDNLRGTVTLATDGTQSVWRRDSMTECTQGAGCTLQQPLVSPCRSFGS